MNSQTTLLMSFSLFPSLVLSAFMFLSFSLSFLKKKRNVKPRVLLQRSIIRYQNRIIAADKAELNQPDDRQ